MFSPLLTSHCQGSWLHLILPYLVRFFPTILGPGRALSGGRDGVVKTWDVETGACLTSRQLGGEEGRERDEGTACLAPNEIPCACARIRTYPSRRKPLHQASSVTLTSWLSPSSPQPHTHHLLSFFTAHQAPGSG